MHKILTLILAIFLLAACSNTDKNVYGNWGVLEIYHGQTELSNNSENIYLTPKLDIINIGSQFNIDFNDKRQNEFGNFKFINENTCELSGMPTKFLNGEYHISIERTKGTDNSQSKTFELTMEKDSVYLRAIKYVIKL